MLEIIILIMLSGKIGKIVESKGRKKIGYQLLLIGMWIGGELFGAVLGGVIGAIAFEGEEPTTLFIVALALGCAITGAVIAFQIAKKLSPLDAEDDFYRDIDYVERLRAREHFGDHDTADRPPANTYTDNPANVRRRRDDRIQE